MTDLEETIKVFFRDTNIVTVVVGKSLVPYHSVSLQSHMPHFHPMSQNYWEGDMGGDPGSL